MKEGGFKRGCTGFDDAGHRMMEKLVILAEHYFHLFCTSEIVQRAWYRVGTGDHELIIAELPRHMDHHAKHSFNFLFAASRKNSNDRFSRKPVIQKKLFSVFQFQFDSFYSLHQGMSHIKN